MKIIKLTLIGLSLIINSVCLANNNDSIITLTDLKYHSNFEKDAVLSFLNHKDSFNIFLAIDSSVNYERAKKRYNTYITVYEDFKQDNFFSKNLNKKIKIGYLKVHDRFLKKYNNVENFEAIFLLGNYNCLSASILYSLVFSRLQIPFKIMASSSHVYLVANPGKNSVVIETTNPTFEKIIFTGEFKRQYVNYLRGSKLINEDEYKNKSVEEIFEEKYNEVKEIEFHNLPGLQYYNQALSKLQNNEIDEALKLSQKAFFFYPDDQTKVLLYTCLLYQIEKCHFDKVSDIDYLSQFSRFNNVDIKIVNGIFNNILNSHVQYTDREMFCDSIYNKFVSNLKDKNLINEISFSFNIQMSYRYQNSKRFEQYAVKAFQIKPNHKDAVNILKYCLNRKLSSLINPITLLDTVNNLESRFTYSEITQLINQYKLTAYLKIACDFFEKKKMSEGDKYLNQFESSYKEPINDFMFNNLIERAYNLVAVHYYYKENQVKAKDYVERGLKYVPDSKLLKSIIY